MWWLWSRRRRRGPLCRCRPRARQGAAAAAGGWADAPPQLASWSLLNFPLDAKPLLRLQDLVHESPDRVIQTLQREGMQRVASFCLPVSRRGDGRQLGSGLQKSKPAFNCSPKLHGMQDKLVLGRLGGDTIATMGADTAKLDFEAAWRRELGPCCGPERRSGAPAAGSGSRRGGTAGRLGGWGKQPEQEWCADIPVVAHVVSVRDAAAPAGAGLLRPLLRRWQAGGCAAATFRLPVVQAGGWLRGGN